MGDNEFVQTKKDIAEQIESVREEIRYLEFLVKNKEKKRSDAVKEYQELRQKENELVKQWKTCLISDDCIEGRVLKVLHDFNNNLECGSHEDEWSLDFREDLIVITDKNGSYIVWWQKIEGKWHPIHRSSREPSFVVNRKHLRRVRKLISDYIKNDLSND